MTPALSVPLMALDDLMQGKPLCQRSGSWPRVRAAHLKEHPTCEACGTTKDMEVHHVWPVSWPGGIEMELDERNLQSLCRTHHFWVGHLGSWKARNPIARRDAEVMLEKIKSRPYPPEKAMAMANDTITIDWPPRKNSAAILTNLGRTLVKLGCWLHGYTAELKQTATADVFAGPPPEAYADPVAMNSWLSELFRKLSGNAKIADEVKAHTVYCWQQIQFPPGSQGKANVLASGGKTDGSVGIEWIRSDGTVAASLSLSRDGVFTANLPSTTPPEPPTP